MVNLWSPRIEYIDYGKSHIDLKPFSKTIVEIKLDKKEEEYVQVNY